MTPDGDTLEDRRPDTSTGDGGGDGDHERFAHYVAKDKLTDAMIEGTPVIALCGKVWVPSRDPQKYTVCPECKKIWESMKRGGDGDSGGDKSGDS